MWGEGEAGSELNAHRPIHPSADSRIIRDIGNPLKYEEREERYERITEG